jgi:hypothetical protein
MEIVLIALLVAAILSVILNGCGVVAIVMLWKRSVKNADRIDEIVKTISEAARMEVKVRRNQERINTIIDTMHKDIHAGVGIQVIAAPGIVQGSDPDATSLP